eukprot:m.19338 g.19338  ORF g.19338 m.19338 type:complete len:231 (+) comp11791_c0_seq1:166-858(+)
MYMQTAATSNTVCGLQLVVLYWDCDSCGCVVSHFFVRMDVAEDDFALGSALWKAAESGDTATAHRLLTSHANPTRLVNRKYVGWTPLQNAAVHGRTDVAALLLTHNAIVNATDIEGCTPLILAARNDQSAMVHLLLGQDADFYATTNDDYGKRTCLHYAAEIDYADVVDVLLQQTAPSTPQQRADWITLFVDKRDINGKTAAELAYDQYHFMIAEAIERAKQQIVVQTLA